MVQKTFYNYIKIEFSYKGRYKMKYELLRCGVDINRDPIQEILVTRGIPCMEIPNYLYTTDADITPPEMLSNIVEGARLLLSYIDKNEKALLIVDSDCDGLTSSAVLTNFLYDLFPTWTEHNLYFFFHEGKQHGLEDVPIEADDFKDIHLVICPDAGSNDYEKHKYFKSLNKEILIIDHHEAEYESKDAIVINNQLCDYPNKDLSGAGIVWQFCRFINKQLNGTEDIANKQLDLVAVGLIADMMSLKSIETKHLIWKGLKQEYNHNPFIHGIVEKNNFSLSKPDYISYNNDFICSPIGAAFFIAPFLNAISRSGNQEEKFIVFKSMLSFKAFERVLSTKKGHKPGEEETILDQALRICTNVKNRQTKAQDDGIELLEKEIKDHNLLDNKVLLFLLPSGAIDSNVAGLCANKLSAKYQRPCCVLFKNIRDNIVYYSGSARGYEKSGISNFRKICSEIPCVEYAQGHGNAFGLSIKDIALNREEEIAGESIYQFIDATNKAFENASDEPKYFVDYILDEQELRLPDIITTIASMNDFWGKDFERAYILVRFKVTPSNFHIMKSNTLKFDLPNKISVIKFSGTEEEIEKLSIEQGYIEIEAVCKCNLNVWNGHSYPQLLIEDYNIVNSCLYYF